MNTIKRISRVYRSVLLLLVTLLVGNIAAEEKPIPPWMHKDVLQAALNIDMNAEQSPQFKVALTRYFNDLNSAIKKVMRRNPTGIEREIKRKGNSVRKNMDKDMAKFLDEDQMSKYYVYRDLLLAKISNIGKASTPVTATEAPSSHSY